MSSITARDDFLFVEEQWSATAVAAHMAPVEYLDGLRVPRLAQEYGARHVWRHREGLFALDGPGHAAAHIALQIGDEECAPDRFAESFGGHGSAEVLSRSTTLAPAHCVPVALARRAQH